jgi:hypothetical protein
MPASQVPIVSSPTQRLATGMARRKLTAHASARRVSPARRATPAHLATSTIQLAHSATPRPRVVATGLAPRPVRARVLPALLALLVSFPTPRRAAGTASRKAMARVCVQRALLARPATPAQRITMRIRSANSATPQLHVPAMARATQQARVIVLPVSRVMLVSFRMPALAPVTAPHKPMERVAAPLRMPAQRAMNARRTIITILPALSATRPRPVTVVARVRAPAAAYVTRDPWETIVSSRTRTLARATALQRSTVHVTVRQALLALSATHAPLVSVAIRAA